VSAKSCRRKIKTGQPVVSGPFRIDIIYARRREVAVGGKGGSLGKGSAGKGVANTSKVVLVEEKERS